MGSRNIAQQTLSFVTQKSSLQWTLTQLGLPEYVIRLALLEIHRTQLSDSPDGQPFAIGSLSAAFQISEHATVLPASVDIRLEITDRCPQEAAVALRYVFLYRGDNPARMASTAAGRALLYESTVTQDGTLLMSGVWQDGSRLAWAERYIPDASCVPSPFDPADDVLARAISDLSNSMPIETVQPLVEPPDAPF